MCTFTVKLGVEVPVVGNGLAVETPVALELRRGPAGWAAQCMAPPVATEAYGRLEEALVAGAQAAAGELQAAVEDRPVVLGRITPEDIPAGMF
ncbi:MAG: hypothetical protein AMXMBFR13_20420 [Phycisphaerae bacterium]|jgi:hypothetical protein